MAYCDLSPTFDLDDVRMFSMVIFETDFCHNNDTWVAATDYNLHKGGIILLYCLSRCLCVSRIIQKVLEGSS